MRGMSELCFHLVLLVLLFTRLLPASIQWLTQSKPLKLLFFEMPIGTLAVDTPFVA